MSDFVVVGRQASVVQQAVEAQVVDRVMCPYFVEDDDTALDAEETAVQILTQAFMRGTVPGIYQRALDRFRNARTQLQAENQWPVVCANYTRLLTKDVKTDVYKRPRAEGDVRDPPPRMAVPASTLGSCDFVLQAEHSMRPQESSSASAPMTPARTSAYTIDPTAEELVMPTRVHSFDHWGRTTINFGKFKAHGWTYRSLATNFSNEAKSYRGWIMSHERTGSHQLKDLAKYLRAAEQRDLFPRLTQEITAAEGVMRAPLEPSAEHR